MEKRRIEEASLNAWPALQQILLDGWILRFSQGYTKRANSANPLYPSLDLDIEGKIDACERLYAAHGLPATFRLTPFASPPSLDRLLEIRGYRLIDPTLVLYLDLTSWERLPVHSAELQEQGLDGWLDIFCRFRGSPLNAHQTHKAILQAIPSGRILHSLLVEGKPVACGLGVLEGDHFGLFDLITDPQWRRQGHGTQLVSGMLAWARSNGARHAYLQVMIANAPARRLYTKFGFLEAYRYWYRVPGTED
jgi:GNAT superfamily N-acetyltransferase